MLHKKIFVWTIILSLSVFFIPEKSKAQYIDVVQAPKEMVLDPIATIMGKVMLKKITAQTVNWINKGKDGNPMFLTDPNQFFTDIADETISGYLSQGQFSKICSPFQTNIKLALVKNYVQEDNYYGCTLNTIKDNFEEFTEDFTKGGWDGWFEMTQTSGGNPFNAYFSAESQLYSFMTNQQSNYQKEIDVSGGFLSQKKCKPGTEFDEQTVDNLAALGFDYKVGDCFENEKETVTPGVTINNALTDALGSPWKQLEAADEINEVVTALVSQLIQRVVGGIGDGLRGASKPSSTGGPSYTQDLANEPQPDPVDLGSLELGPSTMNCTTNEETGEQTCEIIPGQVIGPDWLTPINMPTPTSPAQCKQTDGNYSGPLEDAMRDVLSSNPDIADSMNTTANDFKFLALVAQKASGYKITDKVLNGNDNTNRGDLLAIWKEGDATMERYDVIIDNGSGDKKIKDAITTGFTGSIALNCVEGGGGKNCRCETTDPSNPEPGPKEIPEITSVTPINLRTGNSLQINGKNLTTTVQFFDKDGNRTTEVGQGGGSGVKINIPKNLTPGNYTVKIYKDKDTVSNGKMIVVQGKLPPTINTTEPTSIWTPPQTLNGWWSSVSPDGRYVSYGNWGESWITDLDTKQSWDFRKPSNLPSGAGCIGGKWIATSTVSFVCELPEKDSGFYRYEVRVGEWSAKKTNDEPKLVMGNFGDVREGHWTSYLSSLRRIVIDNKILPETKEFKERDTALISNNQLAFGCDTTRNPNGLQNICITDLNGILIKKYPIKIANYGMAFNNGYIAYGGYGPIHGISPTGTDINLTIAPWGNEGVSAGGLFYVGNTLWLATTSWDDYTGNGFILLRPWGDTRAIAILAEAVGVSVSVRDSNFVITYWNDVGKMYVVTVPINSQRSTLN